MLTISIFFMMGACIFLQPVSGSTSNQSILETVYIDGKIETGEWNNADWFNIPFYLDANNTHGDVDGFNYVSLGEDEDNILMSVDLCSDRTDNESGEWIGFWFNTAQRTFGNEPFAIEPYLDWHGYTDNGTENIVYDAENDRTYPFFQENKSTMFNRYINGDDEFTILEGYKMDGSDDYTEFRQNYNYYELLSYDLGSIHETWLQFDVNLTRFFTDQFYSYNAYAPEFADLYLDAIEDMNISISIASNVSSSDLTTSRINMADADGHYGSWFDPDMTDSIGITNTSDTVTDIDYNITNIDANNTMRFQLLFTNNTDASFETYIKTITFKVKTKLDNGVLKHSSIGSYNIAHDFGPSINSAENHRMFEISVPKSELEHYNANETLGIFIAGYGTLAIEYNPNWWYGASGSSFEPYESDKYLYLYMKGDQPPTPPTPPPEPNIWQIIGDNVLVIIGATIAIIIAILSVFGIGMIRKLKKSSCSCRGKTNCKCDV